MVPRTGASSCFFTPSRLALMDAEIRSRWLGWLLFTEPADRPRAEGALRNLYAAAKPQALVARHIFWFDSPLAAGMAVALLNAAHDDTARSLVESIAQKQGQELVERTRAALCERAQRDWDEITAVVGIRPTIARPLWPRQHPDSISLPQRLPVLPDGRG